MSNYPDFSLQGYEIISELGRNREGGRITWLALNNTGEQVVLKQFCFAQAGSSWSAYNTYQQEIEILRKLNYHGIPKYLESFATPDGFCMTQEYIDAPSLGVARSFAPEEVKEIAIKALEILVYLQNRTQPVIHRDIKPENILVNEQLEVYLIDFGFARIGDREVFGSSVFKGTPGFIPPEQMRQPTLASDLYGLGATLICLLTGVESADIQNLTDHDDPYLIKFQHLLPKLSVALIKWLEKMVQPRQSNRFENAQAALQALKVLDSRHIMRLPEVEFSTTTLNFQATRLGEQLTQIITVTNSVPETLLEGRWEVAPHPHDTHTWISVTPAQFSRDHRIDCYVEVDTSKLMADKLYKRRLFLHTNAYPETQIVNLEVTTAPLPIERRKIPYATLIWLFLICELATMSMAWFITVAGLLGVIWSVIGGVVGFLIGVFGGLMLGVTIWMPIGMVFFDGYEGMEMAGRIGGVIGAIGGVLIGSVASISTVSTIRIGIGIGIGIGIWIVVVAVLTWWAVKWQRETVWDKPTALLFTLIAGFGASVGIGFIIGFHNPFILLALAATGLPLFTMLFYPQLKNRRLIAKYRQSEQHLIQP
jgi:serine/threonine protein kinase